MHDMHVAGFSAGGRHYCLTGGNLREDPPKKTLVPARPRRPGPTIKRHAIHAEIRFACLRLTGSHAGMAAGGRGGSRVWQHVPTRSHGWPDAAHARLRARRVSADVYRGFHLQLCLVERQCSATARAVADTCRPASSILSTCTASSATRAGSAEDTHLGCLLSWTCSRQLLPSNSSDG